jgi:hypothetical protein
LFAGFPVTDGLFEGPVVEPFATLIATDELVAGLVEEMSDGKAADELVTWGDPVVEGVAMDAFCTAVLNVGVVVGLALPLGEGTMMTDTSWPDEVLSGRVVASVDVSWTTPEERLTLRGHKGV